MSRPGSSRPGATSSVYPERPASSQLPIVAEPSQGVLEGLGIGSRLIAKITFGFGGTEEHPVFRHPQSVECQERFPPRHMRNSFRRDGTWVKQRAGQAKLGRLAAAHNRDLAKKLREQDILAAENIVVARLAVPQGGEMAACDIVDMHEIEPGIDKPRNAA